MMSGHHGVAGFEPGSDACQEPLSVSMRPSHRVCPACGCREHIPAHALQERCQERPRISSRASARKQHVIPPMLSILQKQILRLPRATSTVRGHKVTGEGSQVTGRNVLNDCAVTLSCSPWSRPRQMGIAREEQGMGGREGAGGVQKPSREARSIRACGVLLPEGRRRTHLGTMDHV